MHRYITALLSGSLLLACNLRPVQAPIAEYVEPGRPCASPPSRVTPKRAVPASPFELGPVVLGLDGPDEVGLLSERTATNISSQMATAGFKVEMVQAGDAVEPPPLVLTGTVRELACLRNRCRIAVQWVLTNRHTDRRMYELMSRAMVESRDADGRGEKLLAGAMSSLMAHDNFRAAVAASPPARPTRPAGAPQTFASCGAPTKKLPAGSDAVLNATAIVRTPHHTGSAFFVSPDGMAITAAHVLEGSDVTLVLRDGTEVRASAVRSAPDADVALVRPKLPMTGQPCLAPVDVLPSTASDVYAAGSPGGERLAFTMTRGIVSSVRLVNGKRRVQTDTPISPGKSGGPLVDVSGSVVGVVASKLVGAAVEGLAFAVPIQDAMSALHIAPGKITDPALAQAPAASPIEESPPLGAEVPDPTPELDCR